MPLTRHFCSDISSSTDKRIGHIQKFPRLNAWAETLMKRPSTNSFPPDEFQMMYRQNVKRRKKWVSQFVESAQVAAE
jgi:glutathione S-transferase